MLILDRRVIRTSLAGTVIRLVSELRIAYFPHVNSNTRVRTLPEIITQGSINGEIVRGIIPYREYYMYMLTDV